MDRGSINTRIIKRSILKHIARTEPVGTTVGTDYSIVDRGTSPFAIITAQGFSEFSGELAYIRALNNLAAGGAKADSVMIDILVGISCSEDRLRKEMNQLSKLASRDNIRIIGGNSFVSKDGGTEGSFTITAFGKVEDSVTAQLTEKLSVGDKIVILGEAGRFGASFILERSRRLADRKANEEVNEEADKETEEELKEKPKEEADTETEAFCLKSNKNMSILDRFAKSYLDAAVMNKDECYIQDVAEVLVQGGASFIHDVSFGGIYRTLIEIAEYSNHGIDIIHERVPIRQDTIEISEFLGINPYELLGTGGVVAVVKPDRLERLENRLREAGIQYSIAGELTESGERVVHSENFHMKRSLTYYEGDDIFKVV